uniref:protein-serine/threonine phosphatase n=1 Tax=Wollemia nobilis TaxID=56998 RepID=A0A0C9S3F6_9CONI
MVAGRDLCTDVDVAYRSLDLEQDIVGGQLSDQHHQDNEFISDHSSHTQLDVKTGSLIPKASFEDGKAQFVPIIRSGSCSEIGERAHMEDEHICIDDLSEYLGPTFEGPTPNAFYGVFDGHGGAGAAVYVRDNLLQLVVGDADFLQIVKKDVDFSILAEKVVRKAFLAADHALEKHCDVDNFSGTTVLIALIMGRSLLVANAGDCRAVLCRRGRAVEMSRDHKPNCFSERERIEDLGGFVYEGYLNGDLSVSRALGDWDTKMTKGSLGPLSAEPEFRQALLSEEDEFLIIGCDGIWDVMTSECAVSIVRRELMLHNNPEQCSKELVLKALRHGSQDNLTVVVVCFSADPPPVIERPKLRYSNISRRRLAKSEGPLGGVRIAAALD